MGDSNSFSSLMDLVNSHLSKTSLGGGQPGEESTFSFPLASVSTQTGHSQTVFTPPNGVMPMPRLGAQENEIDNILAQQVTNMLIAKEKRKQEEEERQRKAEEINQLKQKRQKDDYVIDLMSCIILPNMDKTIIKPLQDEASSSTSGEFKSLLDEVNVIGSINDKTAKFKLMDMFPLNQDMSYMLFRKVRKGEPSAFGKVICSRVKSVAAPYLKIEVINPTVTRFDFSTRSPCNINLKKRRYPPKDPYAHMKMVERFMGQDGSRHM